MLDAEQFVHGLDGYTGLEGYLVLALTDETMIIRFEQFEATAEVLYDTLAAGPGVHEAFMMKVMKKSGAKNHVPCESQFGKGFTRPS